MPRLTLFLALLAGALAIAPGLARPALARDIFTVRDVSVDVTAASAAAAREEALLDGQRKAFGELMHRLVLRDDYGKVPVLSDPQLLDLVQGIEVEQEKTSSVRYLGELMVSFWPDKVRDFLRSNGLRYAETVSKPVVVIPVLRTDTGLSLWDESNPWFVAWAKHAPPNGLVPLLVPLGDLSDIVSITAQEAVQGNTDKLLATARRYGAAEALVAVASPTTAPTGAIDVDIAVSRFGSPQGEETQILRVSGQVGETTEALYKAAVDQVIAMVEDQWKRENLLRFGEEETLTATVPLTGLKDWIEMRRRLNQVVVVRRAELRSLSHDAAVVRLHFIGGTSQLTTALAQKDVVLAQGQGPQPGAEQGPGQGSEQGQAAMQGEGTSVPAAPPSAAGAPGAASTGPEGALAATSPAASPESAIWVLRFAAGTEPTPPPQSTGTAPASSAAPASGAASNSVPAAGTSAPSPAPPSTPPSTPPIESSPASPSPNAAESPTSPSSPGASESPAPETPAETPAATQGATSGGGANGAGQVAPAVPPDEGAPPAGTPGQ